MKVLIVYYMFMKSQSPNNKASSNFQETIKVEDCYKIDIAQYGANKLFGDWDARQKMKPQDLINVFDKFWKKTEKNTTVENIILKAEVYEYEKCIESLPEKQRFKIDRQQQHRRFRFAEADFIAQLKINNENPYEYQLTNLIRIPSSDIHPKTLFINFNSVEERELFKLLAESLNTSDEKLGLQLLHNFMNLHPGYEITEQSDN